MINKIINFFTEDYYCVAYKTKVMKKFKIVKCKKNYWAADPFLFQNDGKTYLFAELMNKKRNKGEIGYCEFIDGKWSEWNIVIKENYHLSFPNIFLENGNIYICPEANESKQIYLYKAKVFPQKWEKDKILLDNISCCDTVFFDLDGRKYGFTYRIDLKPKQLLLFEIKNDKIVFIDNNPINSDDASARCGGKVINREGKFIRVGQDCKETYGKGLVFCEFSMENNQYSEKIIERKYIDDYQTERVFLKRGVHTYNYIDNLEVIDIKFKKFTWKYFFKKLKYKIFTK